MTMPDQPPTEKKVVLFQVVDRRGTAIAGVKVECYEGVTRIATLKSGKRATRYEPSTAERVKFVAHYREFPPREGTPDVNGVCQIKFPEVDMSPPQVITPTPQPPDHSNVLGLMTVVVGLFAVVAIIGGVLLVYLGAAGGDTEMNILGSTVKTANAGVAAIALGGLVLLFTFRRILKAIEKLAGK